MRIRELVRVFDKPTVGAATADQGSIARERGLDGGMAFCCFCEGQGGHIDVDGAAVEYLGDELDIEMVSSVNTTQDIK